MTLEAFDLLDDISISQLFPKVGDSLVFKKHYDLYKFSKSSALSGSTFSRESFNVLPIQQHSTPINTRSESNHSTDIQIIYTESAENFEDPVRPGGSAVAYGQNQNGTFWFFWYLHI